MAYYHILRQRRQDLNLTIEYVSSQTRLAPQYIQAIESHNLDVFSDDFSFVRYFVHAYCDAIGVNWNAIKDEVDKDINAYAKQREMDLSMAQKRLVQQMPNVSSTQRKKPARSRFQKSVSSFSRNMQWKRKWDIKKLLLIAVVIVCLFAAFNFWLDSQAANEAAKLEANRQEELRQKEEETDRLAQQRQDTREKQEYNFEVLSVEENVYRLSNVIETTKEFSVKIELPEPSKVIIYKDDLVLDEKNQNKEYEDSFEQQVEVDQPCTIAIEVTNYVGGNTTFTIANNTITFNATYWAPGTPATIYIEVVDNESLEEEQSETEEQSSTTQDQSYMEEVDYEFTE